VRADPRGGAALRLRVDHRLHEEAVFRAIAAQESVAAPVRPLEYRRRIDAAYDDACTEDERDRELARLHEHLFSELGFQGVLCELLDEHLLIRERADLVSVQCADRRKAEGAELFVRSADEAGAPPVRTAVLRVYPDSLLDLPTLRASLRRELHHVSDMLDPVFGYEPDLGTAGTTDAQSNLIRDRYALMWTVSIEGRLERRRSRPRVGSELHDDPLTVIPSHLLVLARRVFAGLPDEDVDRRLLRAWETAPATHSLLLELARRASCDASEDGAGEPGAPCPHCGFPTHAWVQRDDGPSCLQCAEMLQAYPD